MAKRRIVVAIGHKDMGTNLPEQKEAVARTAQIISDFIQDGWQVAIVHSNAPQVGMIHTAMNEFGRQHDGYSMAPMSVCSAMRSGLYRLRPSERHPGGAHQAGHLQAREHGSHPGDRGSLR